MTSAAQAGRRTDVASAPLPKRFRNNLVADHLLAAVRAMHPRATPRAFVAEWWDGTAFVPALLVDVEGRRVRAVTDSTGTVALLPRWSWAARRRLARSRNLTGAAAAAGWPAVPGRPHVAVTPGGLPRTPLLFEVQVKRPRQQPGRPGPRPPLRVTTAVDYRACSHIGCGAIVPLPASGDDPPCPRCGRR